MTWLTGTPGIAEPEAVAYTDGEDIGTGWTAQVTLRCPWADRHVLFLNIVQNNLLWPYWPESLMRAQGGTIKGVPGVSTAGSADHLNVYSQADIVMNFKRSIGSPVPGGSETNPEAIYFETITPNGEMLKLPPEDTSEKADVLKKWVFRWGEAIGADKVTADEAPTRLAIGLDYVVRWSRLSSVPAIVLDMIDHVNSGDVVSPSLGLTFPSETLLSQAPVISRTVTADTDSNFFDVEARWSYRRATWNKFWRVKTGTWEEMWIHPKIEARAVYKNYPLLDMSDILP